MVYSHRMPPSAFLLVLFLPVLFLLGCTPSSVQPEAADSRAGPADPPAQIERDQARWADQEAQRRVTDGDYDGAVQAHRQAEKDLRDAERQQSSGYNLTLASG
ncbi:hypothetical protein [Rhodopila sp.]|uniref:hypothetical protein n=1 Tax=Rhodopila sp. TaxID=2480087 RepID=UPI003D09A218